MISHKYKCIFVHIPRTAGSSIEEWICGDDWWDHDPATKHLTAHATRSLYANHWDDYFKFSFVRNPWDRMLSCLHFDEHFGVTVTNGELDFAGYEQRFGSPITLEIDHRFGDRASALRRLHRSGSVYGNLLDEDLDFIGKYENLESDIAHVAKILGVEAAFNSSLKTSAARPAAADIYDAKSHRWIEKTFAADLVRFQYQPPTK